MCGLAGGFVSAKAGQMLAGSGSSNTPKPAPEAPAPTALQPIEPLEITPTESRVDAAEADQQVAMKQQELVNKKATPSALTNTGLQIGADYGESK